MYCINLYGGPGIGKSVIAAEIFVRLKLNGLKAELCTEYAKDLVYENRNETIKDQVYIFGKMQHKLNVLSQTVDFAVVDSPLLLNVVYNDRICSETEDQETFKRLVIQSYNKYTNINIRLIRENDDSFFQQYGRIQNLDESIIIDDQIKSCLESNGVPYYLVFNKKGCFEKTVDQIMEIIKSNTNK